MKLIDIVKELQSRLPRLTEQFTTTLAISTLVHSGTTATLTTSKAHGLKVNDSVQITGAITPIVIESITHVADSVVATIVTATDHDLTLFSTFAEGNIAIVSGANEADFNGSLVVVAVDNRRTIDVTVVSSAPTTGTGTMRLDNGSNVNNVVEGQYAVATVDSSTIFTVEHTAGTDLGTAGGTITVRVKPRITAAITDEAAYKAYSQKVNDVGEPESQIWLFVVIDDSTTSRGRDSRIDAHDTQSLATDWNQHLLQPFSLLVAIPAADDTLGRNARDTAEDLLRPILRSVGGKKFPTGLGVSLAGQAQFVRHAFARYDGSVYWHEYQFEQRAEITLIDTIGGGKDVAFRDTVLTMTPDLPGAQSAAPGNMVSTIDLDDIPL